MESNLQTAVLEAGAEVHRGPTHYVKIWGVLLILLLVSITGPMAGIRALTLFTAFGVAIIKAWLVATEFMHLKYEKKYIAYMLLSMVLLMLIFFYGVAPDVMTPGGRNWERIPVKFNPPALTHPEGGAEAH